MARKRKKPQRATRSKESRPDPRLITAPVDHASLGIDPRADQHFVWVTETALLPDEKELLFYAVDVVAAFLVEAKARRDAGERLRRRALQGLQHTEDGSWRTSTAGRDLLVEAVSQLAGAVVLACSALEAFANEHIDQLPEDATINTKPAGDGKTLDKAKMIGCSLDVKLSRIVPLVTGMVSIEDSTLWPDYQRLKRLRNDIAHVKSRAAHLQNSTDSAVSKVVSGQASDCVEIVLATMRATSPDYWEPERFRELGFSQFD